MTRAARLLALAVALTSCGSKPELTEVPLTTLAGPKAPPLSECPTSKCLTVYVAPWCGICHAVTPHILELRRHLAAKGVATRVVVGFASEDKLRPFAATFGPETQLDPENTVPAKDGMPMFVVTDYEGRLLKRVNGFPSGPTAPENVAAAFGLP